MWMLIWLLLVGGAASGSLRAATIQYHVTDLGVGEGGNSLFRYTYTLSGISIEANQELDFRFDPLLYGTLSNAVAPADFDVLLFQPNNPDGAFGDYSALALIDNPSLAGPFSVDFIYLGQDIPGAQPFFINQYDDSGGFVGTIASGSTTSIPEPAAFAAVGSGLSGILLFCALRHRSRRQLRH